MMAVKTAGLILVVFVYFSCLDGFVTALNCTSPTRQSLFDALEKELFSKKLLPLKHFNETMNVTVDITVSGIIGVEWDIQGLSWDETECGTRRVSVKRENLWVPDILVSEFMDEDVSPQVPYVYLYNTGHVFDDKPIRVVSSCKLGIYTFPFDIQNCSLTFASYLHSARDIRMIQRSSAEEVLKNSFEVIQTEGEWELLDIQVVPAMLTITEGKFSEVKYYVIIRRRPNLYVVNLIIPSCFLLTLDLFSFVLPPQSVDRSAFKMTLILGYTVFLLIMNDLLPVTGDKTPLLNVFFLLSLALMVGSLLETVFITNVQFHSSQYKPVPRWFSVLVLKYIAFIVCVPPKKKSNRVTVSLPADSNPCIMSPEVLQTVCGEPALEKVPLEPTLDELRMLRKDIMAIRTEVEKQFQERESSEEWQMITVVIDRLLFGFYTVFVVASFFAILFIWRKSNAHGH
ncbi:uncharacterized protein V6R79_012002 [Siganus canaliculatus]